MKRRPVGCAKCGARNHYTKGCRVRRTATAPRVTRTVRETMPATVRAALADLDVTLGEFLEAPSVPATRAGCVDGPRPCAYLRCRHRLAVGELGSCALDIADAHPDGLTLEKVGRVLELTRERVRQIERRGIARAQTNAHSSSEF